MPLFIRKGRKTRNRNFDAPQRKKAYKRPPEISVAKKSDSQELRVRNLILELYCSNDV